MPNPPLGPVHCSHHPQARGLFRLLSLDGLNEDTLANALAAVDGHVALTCSGCPQGRSERGPSPLVYCPEFSAFLERSLELARVRPDLGVAPPVLLLQASRGGGGGGQLAGVPGGQGLRGGLHGCLHLAQDSPGWGTRPKLATCSGHVRSLAAGPLPASVPQIVSRLNYGADEALRGSFRQFYLHLQASSGAGGFEGASQGRPRRAQRAPHLHGCGSGAGPCGAMGQGVAGQRPVRGACPLYAAFIPGGRGRAASHADPAAGTSAGPISVGRTSAHPLLPLAPPRPAQAGDPGGSGRAAQRGAHAGPGAGAV